MKGLRKVGTEKVIILLCCPITKKIFLFIPLTSHSKRQMKLTYKNKHQSITQSLDNRDSSLYPNGLKVMYDHKNSTFSSSLLYLIL